MNHYKDETRLFYILYAVIVVILFSASVALTHFKFSAVGSILALFIGYAMRTGKIRTVVENMYINESIKHELRKNRRNKLYERNLGIMKKGSYKLPLIIGVGILLVILLGVFVVQNAQNKAFSLEEQIETAKANINTQEKARMDKVYNLVDCVKQYDKHEAETLISVVKERNKNGDIEASTAIAAITEAYPELKSNENYKTLMNELITIENLISQYRINYNEWVQKYNSHIRKFPTRNFLSITGYIPKNYERLEFEVSSDSPTNLFE